MNKFNASPVQETISNLVLRLTNKDEKIILNPNYQRNIVWMVDDMSNFIDSVLIGIVPNSIIFNIDKKQNKICIDGKQRLTSLKKFKENKIPYITHNNDLITHTYYNKIPNKSRQIENINYKTLSVNDRNKFNQMRLNIIEYQDLSYEDQTDIFNRIQHGKVLTTGEKITAFFSSDKISQYFEKFAEKKENILNKYFPNVLRKEHYPHIIDILYMINKNTFTKPTVRYREAYIKLLDKLPKLKDNLDKIDKLIDKCYGDKLFGHTSFKSNDLHISIRLVTMKFVDKKFMNFKKIKKSYYNILRSAMRKTIKDIEFNNNSKIKLANTSKNNLEKMNNLLFKYYNQLLNDECIITEEEDYDNNLIDDSNNSENSIIETESNSKEECSEESPPPKKKKKGKLLKKKEYNY